MKVFIPLIFLFMFLGWAGYRALFKRDLLKYKNEIYTSLFFFGVWAVIYYFWIS